MASPDLSEGSSKIFDRQRVRQHRERAAQHFAEFDFLKREAAERLADRLDDITRAFPLALDLGAHNGLLADVIYGRGGIETLIQSDMSMRMLHGTKNPRLACDEEWLPFKDNTFDLVMSVHSLHWVNDLPGTLIQIRRALKDDGLMLAMLPGANTLKELRAAMMTCAGRTKGFAPSLSPLVEVRDAGNLLQRAGFALPVVDSDIITVNYANPFRLFSDLRGMGETNALAQQHKYFTRRSWWMEVAQEYQTQFGNTDGSVTATFEFITLTAWKPHESQPKPLARGSGKVNLNEVFKS